MLLLLLVVVVVVAEAEETEAVMEAGRTLFDSLRKVKGTAVDRRAQDVLCV